MLSKGFFLKINAITLGSVLVLILVGSIVRSMGAGMGCPDWPKCFGNYIPPTSSDQLPADYLDQFRSERLKKNDRLAGMFTKLGYEDLALRITTDPYIQQEHEFDVTKAWIEYINRLVGVLIGLFVFLNMVASFSYKDKTWIPIVGVLIFVLTGFQGWVGSLVVSTNLLKGFITFHMLLALLIVALLIWMGVKARQKEVVQDRTLFFISIVLFLVFIPQVVLGTEVRHTIDGLLVNEPNRSAWASYLTSAFLIHRSYSWLILIGSVASFFLVRRRNHVSLNLAAYGLMLIVLATMLFGIIMANFSFPFWTQPLHLLFASGIFSMLFYLILRLKY